MRSIRFPVAPVALVALAALVLAKAFEGVPNLLATAVMAAPAAPPRPAIPVSGITPVSPVVPVVRSQFREIQQQPAVLHGAVVLDLERLESVDAAQALVQYRREAEPPGAPLVCWLAARDTAEAAAASLALARAGCTELRVAA